MLIHIRDELMPALTAALRKGAETMPPGQFRRDAEDALVEIQREAPAQCDCAMTMGIVR